MKCRSPAHFHFQFSFSFGVLHCRGHNYNASAFLICVFHACFFKKVVRRWIKLKIILTSYILENLKFCGELNKIIEKLFSYVLDDIFIIIYLKKESHLIVYLK